MTEHMVSSTYHSSSDLRAETAKVWVDTTEKRELTLRERVLRGEQKVDHVTLETLNLSLVKKS